MGPDSVRKPQAVACTIGSRKLSAPGHRRDGRGVPPKFEDTQAHHRGHLRLVKDRRRVGPDQLRERGQDGLGPLFVATAHNLRRMARLIPQALLPRRHIS